MTSTSSAVRTDLLLQQTRIHFPRFDQARVTPIEKGGSDRKFYRVRSSPEHTLVLVKYNLEKEENRHYVQIDEFLVAHGIRAPKVYFHDEREGLIWIEDLGEADLRSFQDESWLVRRSLYESALEQAAILHTLPETAADEIRKDLPPAFDASLYLWEQQYFFEHCLGRHFAVQEKELAELAALPVLQDIARRLAGLPRVLVHRDFQSQNIMLRNGQAHLIDFQGMRLGLAEYDLASLLYDPYVALSARERDELFQKYRAIRERSGSPLRRDGDEVLRFCAMQRLMQALGAYGYLGLVKGHSAFLENIPSALGSLRAILAEIPGAEKLHERLEILR